MQEQAELVLYEDVVVAESPLLKLKRGNRYGSVPGLDDSELLGPDEIERQIFRQEFEPILTLPTRPAKSWIRPTADEDGRFDFGAFGTVDFERLYSFDKARYKVDKLREELKSVVIMFGIVNERIKTINKYLVLKYLKMGIIGSEHIVDHEMWRLGKLYLRTMRLNKEIERFKEVSRKRAVQKAEAMFGPYDW